MRTLFLTISLILIQSHITLAAEPDFKTFSDKFEKAHAKIISASGKYVYRKANTAGKNVQSDSLYWVSRFVFYRYSGEKVYYEIYDNNFESISEKGLYRDGLFKWINFSKNKDNTLGMFGGTVMKNDSSSLKVQPFYETYETLSNLLVICNKGGLKFNISSVSYNNEVCLLAEFPGSGVAPDIDGVDPSLMETYYNPKTLRKVWVGKDSYKPLRYEEYDENGVLSNSITIEYQKINGDGSKNTYYIPRIIVSDEFKKVTGKPERRTVTEFIGEWEINKKYTADMFKLDFPPGTKVTGITGGEK